MLNKNLIKNLIKGARQKVGQFNCPYCAAAPNQSHDPNCGLRRVEDIRARNRNERQEGAEGANASPLVLARSSDRRQPHKTKRIDADRKSALKSSLSPVNRLTEQN